MSPESLIPDASRTLALRILGGEGAAAFLRTASSRLHRAVRLWDLQPLAPATQATCSIVWHVLRRDKVLTLKLPLLRGEATRDAHVALARRGLGAAVLESFDGSGTMLLERVAANGAPLASYGEDTSRARETISSVIDSLSCIPAPRAAASSEDVLRARLEKDLVIPGRAGRAQESLETLERLASGGSLRSFCHGRLDSGHIADTGGSILLTGPRALAGDPHADLAAWILRASPEMFPLAPAADRAADAAFRLGWDADRAAAWVAVLHAAGVRSQRSSPQGYRSSCRQH